MKKLWPSEIKYNDQGHTMPAELRSRIQLKGVWLPSVPWGSVIPAIWPRDVMWAQECVTCSGSQNVAQRMVFTNTTLNHLRCIDQLLLHCGSHFIENFCFFCDVFRASFISAPIGTLSYYIIDHFLLEGCLPSTWLTCGSFHISARDDVP